MKELIILSSILVLFGCGQAAKTSQFTSPPAPAPAAPTVQLNSYSIKLTAGTGSPATFTVTGIVDQGIGDQSAMNWSPTVPAGQIVQYDFQSQNFDNGAFAVNSCPIIGPNPACNVLVYKNGVLAMSATGTGGTSYTSAVF